MGNLIKAEEQGATMTSLEIAQVTGKRHDNVLAAIRKMESAWIKISHLKFKVVEYVDAKGENQVSPNNPKETQPLWYEDKFEELLNHIN